MQLYLNSVDYMYQLYITYHNKHLVKQEQLTSGLVCNLELKLVLAVWRRRCAERLPSNLPHGVLSRGDKCQKNTKPVKKGRGSF